MLTWIDIFIPALLFLICLFQGMTVAKQQSLLKRLQEEIKEALEMKEAVTTLAPYRTPYTHFPDIKLTGDLTCVYCQEVHAMKSLQTTIAFCIKHEGCGKIKN